jgi:hypothetical protein
MDRCNELCTKETTGQCALCDALAERERFIRFWCKGGLLVDGVRALERRGVFRSTPFSLPWRTRLILSAWGLLLFGIYLLLWVIPTQELASVTITAGKSELTRKEFYELKNSNNPPKNS